MSNDRLVSAIAGWADKYFGWHIHLISEPLIHIYHMWLKCFKSYCPPPTSKERSKYRIENFKTWKLAQTSREMSSGKNWVRFYAYGLGQKRLPVEHPGTKQYLRHFDARVSTDMNEDLLSLHRSQKEVFCELNVFQNILSPIHISHTTCLPICGN